MYTTPKKLIATALFRLGALSLAFAEGISFQEIKSADDWQTALDKAGEQNTLLFVDLYTDWCGYCKKMDKEVFALDNVSEYFNGTFVNVKLDGESDFGAEIAASSQIEGYPTYIFFDAAGNKVDMITGYNPEDAFMEKSKDIQAGWQSFLEVEEAFERGEISKEKLPTYLDGLVARNREKEAIKVAKEAFDKLSAAERMRSENHFLLLQAGKDLDGEEFKLVKSHTSKFDSMFMGKFLENVYQYNLMQAIKHEDEDKLAAINEQVVTLYAQTDEEMEEGRFITKKLYFASLNNWERYEQLVEAYSEEKGNKGILYDEAYQIIENYQNKEAFTVAVGWLDTITEAEPNFEVYALKSYALGMMSEYERALEAANGALDIAKDDQQRNTANEIINMIKQAEQGN